MNFAGPPGAPATGAAAPQQQQLSLNAHVLAGAAAALRKPAAAAAAGGGGVSPPVPLPADGLAGMLSRGLSDRFARVAALRARDDTAPLADPGNSDATFG